MMLLILVWVCIGLMFSGLVRMFVSFLWCVEESVVLCLVKLRKVCCFFRFMGKGGSCGLMLGRLGWFSLGLW